MIRGALAAAVTPLREGGGSLDEDGFGPLVDFLVGHGLDGILGLGTTGEGILLSLAERRRAAELLVEATAGRAQVAVHAGAQTTADTVALAEHAASHGADAVAVIAPPYFKLDGPAILAHLEAAARACAPVPFYVYEFEKTAGYPIPPDVVRELATRVPNLAGMKVSDSPWEAVEPYFIEGLDIFVGFEGFIAKGLAAGGAGAVSGMASAFPDVVVEAVRGARPETSDLLGRLRADVERFPRHAATKRVLQLRGVPICGDVRGPLRGLADAERGELDRVVGSWLEQLPAALA